MKRLKCLPRSQKLVHIYSERSPLALLPLGVVTARHDFMVVLLHFHPLGVVTASHDFMVVLLHFHPLRVTRAGKHYEDSKHNLKLKLVLKRNKTSLLP